MSSLISHVSRLLVALLMLHLSFFVHAQVDQAGVFEFKSDDYGYMTKMVPGSSGYYLMFVQDVKGSESMIKLTRLNDDLSVDWTYPVAKVSPDAPNTKISTELIVNGENIYLFYNDRD